MADLSLPVLVLAGLGLFLSSRDRTQGVVPWLLMAMLLLYFLFFTWRANLDTSRPLLLGVSLCRWSGSGFRVMLWCVCCLGLKWTHRPGEEARPWGSVEGRRLALHYRSPGTHGTLQPSVDIVSSKIN
ncbi:transmembrane protein 260 [Salmo salar]|uniref:Transmembrane protein 260 n=1 Tax=Salmo salar TaxID=8030 RepID=A0A1S3SPN2_SALSA|nr:transmembrane protein 260-like [Salmo salar]